MKTNSVRDVVLAVGLGAGLASSACHDARSTADATSAPVAGGAVLGDRPKQEPASGGSGSANPDTGALASAGAPVIGAQGEARASSEQVPASSLSGAVKANNEFGTALFGALHAEAAGKNFLTSPISASLALGMTYAGAREQTRAEMARALRLGPQQGQPIRRAKRAQ